MTAIVFELPTIREVKDERVSRHLSECRAVAPTRAESSAFAAASYLAALCSSLSLRQGYPARGNERGDGLLYRLKAGKSGAVSKTLPTFFDGNTGATHDVPPRGFCIALLKTALPLIERRKGKARFLSEPAVHRFGISS